MIIADDNVNTKEFDNLSKNFALDLIAIYSLMKEEMFDLIKQAESEGWTPDALIKEVEKTI